jgi:hypothetical protein
MRLTVGRRILRTLLFAFAYEMYRAISWNENRLNYSTGQKHISKSKRAKKKKEVKKSKAISKMKDIFEEPKNNYSNAKNPLDSGKGSDFDSSKNISLTESISKQMKQTTSKSGTYSGKTQSSQTSNSKLGISKKSQPLLTSGSVQTSNPTLLSGQTQTSRPAIESDYTQTSNPKINSNPSNSKNQSSASAQTKRSVWFKGGAPSTQFFTSDPHPTENPPKIKSLPSIKVKSPKRSKTDLEAAGTSFPRKNEQDDTHNLGRGNIKRIAKQLEESILKTHQIHSQGDESHTDSDGNSLRILLPPWGHPKYQRQDQTHKCNKLPPERRVIRRPDSPSSPDIIRKAKRSQSSRLGLKPPPPPPPPMLS